MLCRKCRFDSLIILGNGEPGGSGTSLDALDKVVIVIVLSGIWRRLESRMCGVAEAR